MAMNSVSSEEFSFPSLASHDFPHHSGLDSPPLWKNSHENSHRKDYDFGYGRSIIGEKDDHDQTKSFSYVEMRSRWSDERAEEKMDLLWENLNEELAPRSHSLRIERGGDGGEKKPSLLPEESPALAVGCGKKLSKKPAKKKSPNVLMLMRVLKKLLVLRSLSQRSPAKTHPR